MPVAFLVCSLSFIACGSDSSPDASDDQTQLTDRDTAALDITQAEDSTESDHGAVGDDSDPTVDTSVGEDAHHDEEVFQETAEADTALEDTAPESCELREITDGFSYPEGPYGSQVSDRLADFTLKDCDGNDVSFGQILSQSELVLLNVGAGWCGPCIEETRVMEEEVFQPFCRQGLRIVQVLFQDIDALPTTSLFCQQWRDEYSLTFPVLRDPLFTVESYFDDHLTQTPLNFLIDRDGVIRYREEGVAPDDLATQIEALLPN